MSKIASTSLIQGEVDAYEVGDKVYAADGKTYECQNADACSGTNDVTKVLPDLTAAADATVWKVQRKANAAAPSNEAIELYTADGAACVAWSSDYAWIESQWGCGPGDVDGEKQYRCFDPSYCGMVDPTDLFDGVNTVPDIGGTEVWMKAVAVADTTVRGNTRTWTAVNMTEMNGAARDPSDCATWVEGAHFAYFDLVCEAGAIWECLDEGDAHNCDSIRPSATANADATTWAVPTEGGLESPPASKQVKLRKWERSGSVVAGAIKNVDLAYETGSVATSKDGQVYTCDPAAASFGSKPFKVLTDYEVTIGTTTDYRNIVEGCVSNGPTSKKGANYWVANENVSMDTLTPQDMVACLW
jgi:hypothetical protein